MAREHEVVGTPSLVPEGVFRRDKPYIVGYEVLEGREVVGGGPVEVLDHPCHTEGHEEGVCSARIFCPKSVGVGVLHLMYEPAFYGVYVLARAVMDYW